MLALSKDQEYQEWLVPFEQQGFCLSSTLFMNTNKDRVKEALRLEQYDRIIKSSEKGQSDGHAVCLREGHVETVVYASPCLCPSILHEWLHRPRRYEWPSWELRPFFWI